MVSDRGFPRSDGILFASHVDLQSLLCVYHAITTIKTMEKKTFENIVGKRESAGNQHFLLFPQSFLPLSKQFLNFKSQFSCLQMVLIFGRFMECMVFNTVFNSISFISCRPVHISVLSWSFFNQLFLCTIFFPSH